MKKSILFLLAASTLLFACQKNEITSLDDAPVLHAVIEDDSLTKTSLDEDNNVLWSAGDQVVAFMKTSLGLKYQIKDQYVGKNSGYFSKVSSDSSDDLGAGVEFDHNVVYYPYSDAAECTKSGSGYSLSIALPTEQTYAAGSFGNGSMPMVAVSEDNNITFRNVCGGLKLQLKGTQKVTSIQLEGKDSEKLSGPATVTAYTDETKPVITMASDASTSVTLDCGDGIQLNESTATDFIISVPPVVFTKGFTVTITDSDNNVQTVATDKSNEVKRSSLLVMPEVTLESATVEITKINYIDEYGVNQGPGVQIGDIVWAPVNCGYKAATSEGKGFPCGKLYQWGRRYGQGYSEEYDELVPDIINGPVKSISFGQSKENSNVFYTGRNEIYNDWLYDREPYIWNDGSESNPKKSQYDPCPENWRLPTGAELEDLLSANGVWIEEYDGFCGFLFESTNNESKLFLPAAGYRAVGGSQYSRGKYGRYWSSYPSNSFYSPYLLLYKENITWYTNQYRAIGCSIRCVQVTN